MTRERVANLPADDFRRKDPYFKDPALGQALDKVEKLKALAAEAGKTAAQMSLAWVLRRPEVTSAIVGTRNPAQIEETVAAADWTLTEEEVKAIDSVFDA